MVESFSEISIFPLSLLAEKCKNNPHKEQSIVLDRIKYTEYKPAAAIVDIHGVKPSKLDFILGKQYCTPLPPPNTITKAKAGPSRALK